MSPFLIYKSSAGSGKTTALVGIFLKLMLSEPGAEQFRKVLAITFTNKATNEMKERLLHEVHKISRMPLPYAGGDFMIDQTLNDTGLSPDELRKRAAAAFTRMLFDYGDLSISTIDHFNHKLIRSFSQELDMRADFQVELDVKSLFAEAVMRLTERVGESDAVTAHLTDFIVQQLDDNKKADVIGKLESLRPLVIDEDSVAPMASLSDLLPEDFQNISKTLKTEVATFEAKIKAIGTEAMAVVSSIGATRGDFASVGSSWIPFFENCAALEIAKLTLTATRTGLLEKDWHQTKVSASMRDSIASVTEVLKNFAVKAIHLIENEKPAYELYKALSGKIHLMATLNDLHGALNEILEERNLLPIAYFNRIVSESLRDEPAAYIYEKIGARYDHILIDEFQDTSTLQWLNLLPLVEETISRGKTSLVVGDAKQSIYRWRGGRAEQLISLPDINDASGQVSPELRNALKAAHSIVELNTNYRSAGRVIQFNNSIFEALSHELTPAESLYRQEYDGVFQHTPEKRQETGYVEVNYLGPKAEEEPQHELLYRQICDLRDRGYRLGDICILVRGRREGSAMATYLMERDVPVSTSDSRGIDQDAMVQLLIGFMRLHLDPAHVPSKIAIMRALCDLKGLNYAPDAYRTGMEEARNANLDLKQFLKDIGAPLPRNAWFEPGAFQAAETLIQQYIPHAHAQPAVSALLNYILARGGMKLTVYDFFEHWKRSADKPGAGNADGPDSVVMLTIHKAKGLQFKVCIIPMLNWVRKAGNDDSWVKLGDKTELLPYAPLPASKSLVEMGLDEAYNAEHTAIDFDNLNMIYVALTRAIDELYVNYTVSQSNYLGKDFHTAMTALKPNYEGRDDARDMPLAANELYADLELEFDANHWTFGEKPAHKTRDEIEVEQVAGLAHAMPSPGDWAERFPFAFDEHSFGKDVSRRMGIYFHRLASETSTLAQAQSWIAARLDSAEVNEEEAQALSDLANGLFGDKRYTDLNEGAVRLTERELIHRGEVLRPDLVLDHGADLSLIDFKTGQEKPDHRKQLLRYAEALAALERRPVRGYLLYLDPLKWVEL